MSLNKNDMNNASQDETAEKKQKKDLTVVLNPTAVVLATYILLLVSKLVDVTLLNRDNEYLSVVFLQMMIFLLPTAVWCKLSGEKYLRGLRLKLINIDSIPIIFFSSFLLISGGLLISLVFGGLDHLSGNFTLYNTFVSNSGGGFSAKLYLILAYAALPAICEEVIYRGILCHEYEKGGVTRAIVFSSVFFALLHFDIRNLPVYLFSGVILALTFYVTRSLLGSILAHFLYNIFGIFGQPYMSTLYNITDNETFFVFIVITTFLLSATLFCAEAARLYKKYLYEARSASYRYPIISTREKLKESYLSVIKTPSAIACFGVYIIAVAISLF